MLAPLRNRCSIGAVAWATVAWTGLAWSLCDAAASARAKEPVQQFLAGLRQAGMFAEAREYLESLPTKPFIDETDRQLVPYELGRILVAEAEKSKTLPARMELYDRARAGYEEFSKKSADHPLAAEARAQVGNLLVARARGLSQMAKKAGDPAKRQQLTGEARDAYRQARGMLDEAAQKAAAEYTTVKNRLADKSQQDSREVRTQARIHYIQTSLIAGNVTWEAAKAAGGDREGKELLRAAAGRFQALAKEFAGKWAGLQASLSEGKCYEDLGDSKKALTIYEGLLAQTDRPELPVEFRDLRAEVLAQALGCWTSESQRKYQTAESRGADWLAQALPEEAERAPGLAIRYYIALAMDRQMAQPKPGTQSKPGTTTSDKAAGPSDSLNKEKVKALVDHALFVAAHAGEHQQQAAELVALYQKPKAGKKPKPDKKPKKDATGPADFAEAYSQGREAMTRMEEAAQKIKILKAAGNKPNKGKKDEEGEDEGAEAEEIKEDLPTLENQEKMARSDTIRLLRQALTLRTAETPVADLNVARYYLAYALYLDKRYYESAVLGEFLARGYPKTDEGKDCANIALNSYVQAYQAAPKDDRQFELTRMSEIAAYLGQAWPGEPQADQAWMVLAELAIRDKELARAAGYLEKIPADSPRRAEADLKAGQALWGSYLAAFRLSPDERPPQAELDKIVQEAQTILERGIRLARAPKKAAAQATLPDGSPLIEPGDAPPAPAPMAAQPDFTLLASELSLAQIYVGTDHADKAVKILETPETGALALVRAESEVTAKGNFPIETLKAALRAYVGVNDLEKAEATMHELDAVAAESPGSEELTTKIYISLGMELEDQVERLRNERKLEELERVLKGFELFLTRIAEQKQGNTYRSLNWVADTFFRLGSGLDTGEKLSSQAQGYYEKAASTYSTMLARVEADKSFAPTPQSKLALLVRVSKCKRRLGDYNEALAMLEKILKENPKMLEAQLEAAYTYQEWGAETPSYYERAMRGGREDKTTGANLVWGWNLMANKLSRSSDPKHRVVFHEARYNLAECRFKLAMSQSGDERNRALADAERDIIVTYRLSPALGDEKSYARFDRLLKDIQQAKSEPRTGLNGLDAKSAAAPAAAQTSSQ